MSHWLVEEIIQLTKKSIQEGIIVFSPLRVLKYTEDTLCEALIQVKESDERFELMRAIVEFLINCRRKHFAYMKSGELWDFMQAHLNQDFNDLEDIPGPFGMFIETSGIHPAAEYSLVPVTKEDLNENSNPYASFFSNFIAKAQNHFMSVIYNSSADSKYYNFNFNFSISQFFIPHSHRESINTFVSIVDSFFELRNKDFEATTMEENLLKNYLLQSILETPIDWFEHAFQANTHNYSSNFDFDTFEFIKNMNILHSSLCTNKQGLMLETENQNEEFKLMMIDFSATRKNGPPDMRWLSSADLQQLMNNNPLNDLWPAAIQFNETIKQGELGFWYSDSEFTAKYGGRFSFYLKI